jgi:hypothetical protein
MADNHINLICSAMNGTITEDVMVEMEPVTASMPPIGQMGPGGGTGEVGGMAIAVGQATDENGEEEFTDKEMKMAKRFIELCGSADRVQELLDKALECEDCLGMIDDEEQDATIIAQIGEVIPSEVDMPTATNYNPGM